MRVGIDYGSGRDRGYITVRQAEPYFEVRHDLVALKKGANWVQRLAMRFLRASDGLSYGEEHKVRYVSFEPSSVVESVMAQINQAIEFDGCAPAVVLIGGADFAAMTLHDVEWMRQTFSFDRAVELSGPAKRSHMNPLGRWRDIQNIRIVISPRMTGVLAIPRSTLE
jgi:hypothetical protein